MKRRTLLKIMLGTAPGVAVFGHFGARANRAENPRQ